MSDPFNSFKQEILVNMSKVDSNIEFRNQCRSKKSSKRVESTNNRNVLTETNYSLNIQRSNTHHTRAMSTASLGTKEVNLNDTNYKLNDGLKYFCKIGNKIYEYRNNKNLELNMNRNTNSKEPNYIANNVNQLKAATRNIDRNVENMVQYPEYDVIDRPEKMTYCRPVNNTFNQEFVKNTLEKTIRLQDLVKRVARAREREKQNEVWNNYINELKNKHRSNDLYLNNQERIIKRYMYPNEEYYGNNRYTYPQLNYYSDNVCYGASYSNEENMIRSPVYFPSIDRTKMYPNEQLCFPTSSQGRLMVLQREKYGVDHTCGSPTYPLTGSYYSSQPIKVENERTPIPMDRRSRINQSLRNKCEACKAAAAREIKQSNLSQQQKSTANVSEYTNQKKEDVECQCNECKKTQVVTNTTTSKQLNDKEYKKADSNLKNRYTVISKDVEQIRKSIQESKNTKKQSSLTDIEKKLDVLIQSLNSFMNEVKSQHNRNVARSEKSIATDSRPSSSRVYSQKNQTICQVSQSSISYLGAKLKQCASLEDILTEEKNKSDKVKRDIEEILNTSDNQCALQITIDIPTKEHSTEVTDSLCKAGGSIDNLESNRRMTIAVNTDPLGLLALLRVSSEAVKQILSYVPNIEYFSFIAGLHARRRSCNEDHTVSQFLCNICGASFVEPSQLTEHIQRHNLGKTRNCCVCRHLIEMKRHRSGWFPCQHCGQVFTRAYCRHLHEQTCSKKLADAGSDVTPKLEMPN